MCSTRLVPLGTLSKILSQFLCLKNYCGFVYYSSFRASRDMRVTYVTHYRDLSRNKVLARFIVLALEHLLMLLRSV